ncbi:SDR family NAD(P)-dependent oxidoreductase [Streptomyces sp. NPDC050619]|uniref:SDR family NAD(P)-dependent oxidoreductase n=1 Tax=Streptomyces sp. NPDC050619 TaxID=3157214 RepID=UPI00343105B4
MKRHHQPREGDGIVSVLADEPLIEPLSAAFGGDIHASLPAAGPVRAVVVGAALTMADGDELRCVAAAARRARGAARLLAGQRGGVLVCVLLLPEDAVKTGRTACESLSGFVRSAAAELSFYGVSVQGVLMAERTEGARLVHLLTDRPDPAATGQIYLVSGTDVSRVAAPSVERELLRADGRPTTAQVAEAFGAPAEHGLADRVVIVTGGGGGIGRAVATGLAEEGATVVVADLGCDADGRGRDPAFAEETADAITRRGGRALAFCTDVSRPDECRDLVSHAVRAFGRVDALCHAAGVVRQALVQEATDEDWDAALGVHVAGARHLVDACLGPMRERGHGRIVLFSSRSVTGSPGLSTYSTAKGAVLAYGRSLAEQVAGSGVRVNVVLPSGRTRASAPEAPGARRRRIELLRARHHGITDPVAYRNSPEQDPENNVAAISWLCGPQAASGLLVGTGGRRVDLYRPGVVDRSVPLPLTWEDLRALAA